MPKDKLFDSWIKRFRHWWSSRLNRGRRPAAAGGHAQAADSAPPPTGPYPDYVTCPHCGEPEVEVWCNEPTARCHNCGQTFDHPLPPECESDSQRPSGSSQP